MPLLPPDLEHSFDEEREWIIGESDFGVLVVVFTKRNEGSIYRLISARKANKKERSMYAQFKNLPL